ncbi:MAG: tetraacyldisaccharide 4'-kinase [Rikenellaceae bacterium]
MLNIVKIPLSWIYSSIVAIRNKMFDMNILKSEEYDIPIVCVGNLSVGGTGKTPHTEMLVKMLKKRYNVAVLSRGYKRESSGYYEVRVDTPVKKVGDEPMQIKLKFPDVIVAVCEDRRAGINIIRKTFKDVNLIIMDDGFQHRYVEPWLSIILTEHSNLFYNDKMLPYGSLRENIKARYRAQVIIVTKVDNNVKPLDLRFIYQNLNLYPYQQLYFTQMALQRPELVFTDGVKRTIHSDTKVIAMAGIAKPDTFYGQLKDKYNIVDTLSYPDHYDYKRHDLKSIEQKLKKHGEDSVILMTEKDAVKFARSSKVPSWLHDRMYVVRIEVEFMDLNEYWNNDIYNFEKKIVPYVEKNHKHHPVH